VVALVLVTQASISAFEEGVIDAVVKDVPSVVLPAVAKVVAVMAARAPVAENITKNSAATSKYACKIRGA
jgi:hypothetical protein